jgi:hypothetical protein
MCVGADSPRALQVASDAFDKRIERLGPGLTTRRRLSTRRLERASFESLKSRPGLKAAFS